MIVVVQSPWNVGTLRVHVGLILGLAEQEKLLRKIVKNNYQYKTTSVQTISWKKKEETNEQRVPMGVSAEKVKGLFVSVSLKRIQKLVIIIW